MFTMCLQYPQRPEEAIGSSRTGVTDSLSYLMWVLSTKPGSSARAVFQLLLVTVINQNDLRRKGFISAHRLQFIIQGNQGRNRNRDHRRVLLTGLLLLAVSGCCLLQPTSTRLGMVLPTEGWAFSHPLAIKKIPHRHGYMPAQSGRVLNRDSLSDSSFLQVDENQTAQTEIHYHAQLG